MVALTALGMTFTTTTHAADFDSPARGVYSNEPQSPTTPQVPGPLVPGPLVPGPQVPDSSRPGSYVPADPIPYGPPAPADVYPAWLGKTTQNNVITYKFRVYNMGPGTAKKVLVSKIVNMFENPGAQESQVTTEFLVSMAPGAYKDVTFSCAPKAGQPPCFQSAVQVTSDNDNNTSNNFLVGA